MSNPIAKHEFYWHESAGARILVPSRYTIQQPFPELFAQCEEYSNTIHVTITSQKSERSCAEGLIRQRLVNDDNFRLEALREGAVTDPYPGIERVVQLHNLMAPSSPSYYWRRMQYLDEAANIIADIDVRGEGLFRNSEHMWQTVLDSFSWNHDEAIVLNTYEEFYAFRTRYAPERKKREVEPGSVPQLPPEIAYLQPVMDELMTYYPEDLNEDADTTLLDNLVQERIRGLSAENALNQVSEDNRTLGQWLREAKEGGSQAAFIQGYLEGYIIYGFGRWWEQGKENS